MSCWTTRSRRAASCADRPMTGYQYEFERVEPEEQGYSLLGGIGLSLEAHREIIARRAAGGWRFAGCIPVRQRMEGFVEAFDLVFERPAAPAGE